jgi:hypothetical protein
MPSARRVPVLMTLITELDRGFWNKFFGDGAKTGSKIASFWCNELRLSLERDNKRPEKNTDGAPLFKQ